MEPSEKPRFQHSTYMAPGIAGALAGMAVEVGMFPLDTIKTRLQSEAGFHKAGGFRGLYKGIAPVAAASMPAAALFFISYETVKALAEPLAPPALVPVAHIGAAALAEITVCLIRVPTEVMKQRQQTYVGAEKKSSFSILYQAYKSEGLRKGVYRGYLSTLARDLPYGCLDIPIWEWMKQQVRNRNNGEITSFQSACCGAAATVIAGAITTPLDVAKTRIILAQHSSPHSLRILPVLGRIYREGGVRGLFAGGTPRVCALMVGAFLFFGVYDEVKSRVMKYQESSFVHAL